MKKCMLCLICLIICLVGLSGCSCKHIWVEADCVTAKTCSDCGETEGEPLGHSWMDASCEAPKTCTACSATEGQPLAHSEAVRDCAIDYVALTMERQTYCMGCNQILSSEEIHLDALHDGPHFLFDSQSFWERYATIDEEFSFTYLNDTADVATEETTTDTLILECRDAFGYVLKVRFRFDDLVEADREHALPCCTRIVVDPAVSGEVGDPDPSGLLDFAMTPEDIEYANEMREKAHLVAINELMFRNLMVAFMTIDPNLDPVYIYDDDGVIALVLGVFDILDGKNPEIVGALELVDGEKPGVILNGIYYYENEDGELVIEVAP